MKKILACLVLLVLSAAAVPARGQGLLSGIINASVSGNGVSVTVSLPGGLGADLTLGFEEVTGLSLANLGISARLVNPFDLSMMGRLPRNTLMALPVMLRIEPPAAGGLTFKGVASFGIHTHNLLYLPNSPLRLFSASIGGPFEDFTEAMSSGSYRACGTKGGFSEFLIVIDLRSLNSVITNKFDRLEDLLEDYEGTMPGSVYDDLEERLEDARDDFASGATVDAIAGIDGFLGEVEEHSGTDIPNVWRAARNVDNVAGYLRQWATTLRFSLDLKRAGGH